MSVEYELRRTNINYSVRVKLTDHGKTVWMESLNIPEMSQYWLTDEKIEAKKKEDGYWSFQFWDFMEIFGHASGLGRKPCFEADIFIEVIKPNTSEKPS